MVIQWVGAAITLVLLALVLGGIWWLVGDARAQRRRERAAKRYAEAYEVEPTGMGLLGRMGKHRRPGHLLHTEDDSLTVEALVKDASAQGQPVRLNWSVLDEQRTLGQGWKRRTGDDWPTGILPRVPKGPKGPE